MKKGFQILSALILVLSLSLSLFGCRLPEGFEGNGGGNGTEQGGQSGSGSQGGSENGNGGSENGNDSSQNGNGGSQNGNGGEKPLATEGLEFTQVKETDSYKVTGYSGSATEIIIPEEYLGKAVTVIGAALHQNTSVTKVTIPDSVTEISDVAFSGCTSLSEIQFGSGVRTVGYSAFANCSSLITLTLPDSVELIDGYGFSGCTSLVEVTFGSNFQWLGANAFGNCTSLERVNFPEGSWYYVFARTDWNLKRDGEIAGVTDNPEEAASLLMGSLKKYRLYRL